MMRAIPIWTDFGLMFSFFIIVSTLIISTGYIIIRNWKEMNKR